MSEVLTQTPASSSEALPAGAATAVPVAPSGNNALSTSNTPAATSETPVPGASWGVDFDKINDSESLALAIEGMNLPPLPDENAPEVHAPEAAPSPAPAPAAPSEDGLTRPGEMPRNIKLPVRDELDFQVATLIKEARLNGRELSFAQAETQALTALGRAPAPAPAPVEHQTPAPAADVTPPAPGEQSPELAAAYDAYQTARSNFDADAEVTALRQINALERVESAKFVQNQQQEAITAQHQQQVFNSQWEANLQAAQRTYPDAANPESALTQRAAEIQQSYAASPDPAHQAIYNSPSSAMFYFQQAAAEMQVAPAAPTLVQKSTPQPVPQNRPPMSALLAGGNAGNTAPAAPGFDPNRITNSHDLDALIDGMEGKWAA